MIHRLGQEQEHDARLKLLLARTQPSRWPEVLIVTSTEFDKLQGKLAELFMGFHVNQGLLMEVEIVLARVVEIMLIVFLGGVSLWYGGHKICISHYFIFRFGLFEWYRVFSMFRAWTSSCYSL